MDKVRMNYKKFYNQIKYRTNVFEWYPFKMNSSLLYIGDSPILIDFFEGKPIKVTRLAYEPAVEEVLPNWEWIETTTHEESSKGNQIFMTYCRGLKK